ncbi:MAG: hypothetical protein E7425_13735 [Ruminococcaceae bacterium]|jgi:hypothetical protein|nr:hypothetical protein [Oscillospiraceae bacterium]
MNRPLLDPRSPETIREQIRALARSYTPEWRYEGTENDPGAALAELFAEMYGQSVDRLNALPEKLFIEFLNMIGYREPGPMPSVGTVCLDPQDSATEPFTVAAGTQLFTPDDEGENIVFETDRTIQISAAKISDIYYVDAEADSIRRLGIAERPQRFFVPTGEELQRHRFMVAEDDVLRLDCPARILATFHQESGHREGEAAKILADDSLTWTFRCEGEDIPFDDVHAESGTLVLSKNNRLIPEADESGHICISCSGHPKTDLNVDAIELSCEPITPCAVRSMYNNDIPISLQEGGYCFGRRPGVYNMFYLNCDSALTKHGADVLLHLDIAFVVDEPETQKVRYDFTQPIIDKQSAVEQKPDDVTVSEVVWEYYNGIGWKNLQVSGDKNPFSSKRDGALEVRFRVPEDMDEAEVNAEIGYFIRARVVDISNPYSTYQRWVVPLVKGAYFHWQYTAQKKPVYCFSENNGQQHVIEDAHRLSHLMFPALAPMTEGRAAMYFRFSASPHAMPLSLRFQVEGRARLTGQLLWEYWNGKDFEPIRTVDQTERLLHSGEMFLFLPERLPEAELFGEKGCWLRLNRSTSEAGIMPMIASVTVNAVSAHQHQREADQLFDTEIYEAGKRVWLLNLPVQECRVWVDELSAISDAELETLQRESPKRVRLEWEGHSITRCWIEWERVEDLALAGPNERVFTLEPFSGQITFGDGRQGKVPPAGDHNIRVRYSSGGGERGNVPAGAIRSLLTAMPQVSRVRNLTAMSGGTGRLALDEIEERGSRFLHNRGRAAGRMDYEELVREKFPQVNHVRCFAGHNERGERAPGHIAVVVAGFGKNGEGTEDLCGKVYRYLSEYSSCCLVAENRLHVCPATVLTVNTSVTVQTERPELAAETQQAIVRRLEKLIGKVWKSRPIGEQIRLSEVWSVVRDTPNVRLIERILVEASYDQEGRQRLAALEADSDFPYSVAESGMHLVRLS